MNARAVQSAAVIFAACCVLSCRGSHAKEPAIPPPSPDRTEASPEEGGNAIAVRYGGLQFSFALQHATVRAGEPIVVEVALRNVYVRPARVVFATRQRFDLIVSRDAEESDLVTGWSWGQKFEPMRLEMFLERDQAIARTLEIPTGTADAAPTERAPFLPPGKYFLSASTTSDPFMRTPAFGITVLAPEEAAPDQQ